MTTDTHYAIIEALVRRAVANELSLDRNKPVDIESTIYQLGGDSLDEVAVLMRPEDWFNIENIFKSGWQIRQVIEYVANLRGLIKIPTCPKVL